MDKSRANILQIQKYLNGELDAKGMHQLEREAQDDPFLMDALEGYGVAARNQQPNLDILADRLNVRVNKRERRIIPWTTISIAAGVIGFMIVVGLLYQKNQPAKLPLTAVVTEPVKFKPGGATTAPIITTPNRENVAVLPPQTKSQASFHKNYHRVADRGDDELKKAPALKEVAIKPLPVMRKDSTPLDEMVMGVITSQKDSVEMPLTVAITKKPGSQSLVSKAKGVQIIKDKRTDANAYELSKLNLPAGYSAPNAATNMIVPPSTMKSTGKPAETLIDSKGKFTAPAVKPGNAADVSNVGLEAPGLNTNIGNLANNPTVYGNSATYKAYTNTAGLNSNTASLNGYFNSAVNTTDLTLAHPQKGWILYQLYLSQKGYLPAGEKPGIVELKFTVSATGTISNITVVKGLSPATDKKAISLVAQGPKWVGNANGKPEEKTLLLEFIIKK